MATGSDRINMDSSNVCGTYNMGGGRRGAISAQGEQVLPVTPSQHKRQMKTMAWEYTVVATKADADEEQSPLNAGRISSRIRVVRLELRNKAKIVTKGLG